MHIDRKGSITTDLFKREKEEKEKEKEKKKKREMKKEENKAKKKTEAIKLMLPRAHASNIKHEACKLGQIKEYPAKKTSFFNRKV